MSNVVKLGDLCEVVTKGTTPTSVGHNFVPESEIKFIKIESLNTNGSIIQKKVAFITAECHKALFRSQLKENDILFSIAGALGRVGIVNKDILPANTNQALAIIRLKDKSESSIRFLQYYFQSQSVTYQINGFRGGVAQQNLSLTQIKDFDIPILTQEKQQKIVKKLDAAFEAIDRAKANLEKNIQNAKELFQSKLNEVFKTGKQKVKSGDNQWILMKLGDIGKVSMCKRIFKDQTSEIGDIPFYKIGTFGKKPDAFISKEIYDDFRSKYSFPRIGDVMLSASGTIGRRVRYDGKPAYFQDSNIVWISNNEKHISNDFLFHYYGACNWTTTKGATISRLYNDNLKSMEITFPKSFETQKKIVNELDQLSTQTETLQQKYNQKLQNLEDLRKSILEKAFKGELTN